VPLAVFEAALRPGRDTQCLEYDDEVTCNLPDLNICTCWSIFVHAAQV
jgi:hypothetical protein